MTVRSSGLTWTVTASRMWRREMIRTTVGTVAENIAVWRLLGVRRRIRSTSGMKPMSSIRSASSSTRYVTLSKESVPRFR